MKNIGMKASWLLPVMLAASGLFITGLSDTAPEAQAEGDTPAAVAEELAANPPTADAQAPATNEAPPATEAAVESSSISMSRSGRISSKGCLTDEAAIEDMQKLKAELEEKSKALTKREAELVAKETALAEELKKIEAVRDEIKVVNQTAIGKNAEKISKLVETFEAMSPKAAALVVNNIEQALAVAALKDVSSTKLAKILSAMSPNDSGPLTEALAGVVRVSKKSPRGEKRASNDASGTTDPGNGGEKENGNNQEQQRQPASGGPTPATGR